MKKHQQYISLNEAMEWEVKTSRLIWFASWTGWKWLHRRLATYFVRRTQAKYARYQAHKSHRA